MEEVLEEAGRMAASGFREIVLTGVDLASWGRDHHTRSLGLADLVGRLVSMGGFRIRLGSLEPMGLGRGELSKLGIPGVCRHLHFSFQSGSTRLLGEMARNYTGDTAVALIEEARRAFPGCIVGSDLMAGFPGETEDDFKSTQALLEHGLLDYAHVFPFSPRPGTPIMGLHWKEPRQGIASQRAKALRNASAVNRKAFWMSQVGVDLQVLVEDRRCNGRYIALSDNYVPLYAPDGAAPGDFLSMKPEHSDMPGIDMDIDDDEG